MKQRLRRLQQHFLDHPWLSLAWAVNLLLLPLMAVFGRGLAETLDQGIGDLGIRLLLGGSLMVLLVAAGRYLVRKQGWFGLLHLVWPTIILLPILGSISRNPERWLHIPLFGMLGFLSAALFSLRTGAEIALAYAFGDELLQLYLPERHGSFEDVLINGVSAAIGVAFCWLLGRETD